MLFPPEKLDRHCLFRCPVHTRIGLAYIAFYSSSAHAQALSMYLRDILKSMLAIFSLRGPLGPGSGSVQSYPL